MKLERLLLQAQPIDEWARHFLPRYFPLPNSGLHHWLTAELATLHKRRGAKQTVVAPRGGAKSTWASLVYPLRCALNQIEPYTVIISDTQSQANQLLKAIKAELEANDEIAAQYPEAAGEGPIWREDEITLRNGVVIKALGTGGKIRGRRERESRPTLIVVDDPENDEHITSEHQREVTWEWFTRSVLNAGNDDTNTLVLGTALHRDCLVLKLGRTAGWSARTFRAIEKWPDRMDLWAEWETIYSDVRDDPLTGEWHQEQRVGKADVFYAENQTTMNAGCRLLWPEHEPLLKLMKRRATIGHGAFESEKQGNPINPSTCEWPSAYFDGPDIWFDDWPSAFRMRAIALDPSKGKDARRGDYSAFVMLLVGMDGYLYVDADMRNDRPVPQIVADALGLYRLFPAEFFGVEINGFQELLAADIQRQSAESKIVLPVWGINNSVNKQVRIRRLGPYFSQRRVKFRRRSPGVKLLMQQLAEFPVGDHDDGPDALEMAVRLATEVMIDAQGVGGPKRMRA
jgi:predicted phage terminase large subunit-like protein